MTYLHSYLSIDFYNYMGIFFIDIIGFYQRCHFYGSTLNIFPDTWTRRISWCCDGPRRDSKRPSNLSWWSIPEAGVLLWSRIWFPFWMMEPRGGGWASLNWWSDGKSRRAWEQETAGCNIMAMTGLAPPLWHDIPVACELLAGDRMPCHCCGAPMDDEEV